MLALLKSYLALFLTQIQYLFSPEKGAIDHKKLQAMTSCDILVFDPVPGTNMYYERFSPNVLYPGDMLKQCLRDFIRDVNKNDSFPSDSVKSVLIRKLSANDNDYLVPRHYFTFPDSVVYSTPVILSDKDKTVIVLAVYGPGHIIEEFSTRTFVPRFKGKQMARHFKPSELVAIDYE